MGASHGRPWSKLAAFVAVAAAGLSSACSPFGASAFVCETDAECGAGGQCEPTAYCSFPDPACGPGGRKYGDHSPLGGTCVGDVTPGLIDAATDAPPPATCTPGAKACFGVAIETCKGDGQGFDPAQRQPCALACDASSGVPRCLAASSIAVSEQLACGNGDDPRDLQTQSSSVVTFGTTEITCTGCLGGVDRIAARGTAPNTWYCLKTLILMAGTQVRSSNAGPVTLFVAGTTQIDADLDLRGGPGAFAGAPAPADNTAGTAGLGACPGLGGERQGNANDFVGGGGGGAGGAGSGGRGGNGNGAGQGTAAGGDGGAPSAACDAASVMPLRGGSGGGSGGDGSCGPMTACGGAGGAGGGALHIASRADILGTGSIDARGADGSNSPLAGGAGGGGAGGAVLLEAPRVLLTGRVRAGGGDGGDVVILGGGDGADDSLDGGDGISGVANGTGGTGGGGAAGRIRINAAVGASCANAEPQPACSTGSLPAQ